MKDKVSPDKILDLSIAVCGFPVLMIKNDNPAEGRECRTYFGGLLESRTLFIKHPIDRSNWTKLCDAINAKWPGLVNNTSDEGYTSWKAEVMASNG